MNNATARHLEYDKLLHYIKAHCHSVPGDKYIATFTPSTDKDFIDSRLNLINDIQHIIRDKGDYDFTYLTEIEQIFTEVASLAYNFEEFQAIIDSTRVSNTIYDDFLKTPDTSYSTFLKFINSITPLNHLQQRFDKIFDHEGNVLDTASVELKSIRKSIRGLKVKIQTELNNTINDTQLSNYLQDKIITKRDERFVIPVKENFAYMLDGISHGRSGSGASVYVEPKNIVPLNNELNNLISAEKEEIYRIFCDFTKQIRAEENAILDNYKITSKLDTYFACGRVSNELQAIVPEIVADNIIELQRARHPLLILKFMDIKKVIPFDLTLGKDFKILLISGPNTGGKTITLKTIGLCTMMALTGLPITANFGSKIGLFSGVFADIGDNQSIESSLSTYSGHIENIKQIVDNGNANSLVLIDEIGSATDPEQGVALAQAIMENLVEKQALAVITTHFTTLKIFAENTPNCVNAAMQFDPDKHQPTYQFVLGFPGNSFAIEIASKLGLNETLINRAKALTGSKNVELTDLIKKMNEEKKRLSENNYQLELKTRLFEMKSNELADKISALEKDKKKLLKASISDTQDYLTNIQKQLNDEISTLKKLKKEEKKQKITQINNEIVSLHSDLKNKKHSLTPHHTPPNTQNLTPGDTVYLTTFDTKATIIDIQKDSCKVEMNGIFFNVKMADLHKIQDEPTSEPVSIISSKNTDYDGKAKMEINLLGKTFDEALPQIQDLIDNALFAGLSKVRIIHGRGTGVLRQKIRDFLKSHPKVSEYYSPASEAGGDGVTVVALS